MDRRRFPVEEVRGGNLAMSATGYQQRQPRCQQDFFKFRAHAQQFRQILTGFSERRTRKAKPITAQALHFGQ
jgi:hypothetical protein